MKGNWHRRFEDRGMLKFTDEMFQKFHGLLLEDLPFYTARVPEGGRILEAACGPGVTAIPLSHHYMVTAFDRDEKILAAARKNGEKHGKDIEFRQADFFNIQEEFGTGSYDAVSSGGVLEHFSENDIWRLTEASLDVAPVMFASMPLFSEEEVKTVNEYGIETYHYTMKDYLEDIFADYNVLAHRLLEPAPQTARFREFMIAVSR